MEGARIFCFKIPFFFRVPFPPHKNMGFFSGADPGFRAKGGPVSSESSFLCKKWPGQHQPPLLVDLVINLKLHSI